jgi:hypothetical protein
LVDAQRKYRIQWLLILTLVPVFLMTSSIAQILFQSNQNVSMVRSLVTMGWFAAIVRSVWKVFNIRCPFCSVHLWSRMMPKQCGHCQKTFISDE